MRRVCIRHACGTVLYCHCYSLHPNAFISIEWKYNNEHLDWSARPKWFVLGDPPPLQDVWGGCYTIRCKTEVSKQHGMCASRPVPLLFHDEASRLWAWYRRCFSMVWQPIAVLCNRSWTIRTSSKLWSRNASFQGIYTEYRSTRQLVTPYLLSESKVRSRWCIIPLNVKWCI